MVLALYAAALVLIVGVVLWFSVSRWWHAAIIAVLWVPFFTPVAWWLTGDVSRYLPPGTFPDGPTGKDAIVLTSVLSTVAVSVMLAAALQWSVRWVRSRSKQSDSLAVITIPANVVWSLLARSGHRWCLL